MSRYLEIVRAASHAAPLLTLPELFCDCNRLGLTLQHRGGSVRFAGNLSAVTPELQAALDRHQAELLQLVDGTSRPPHPTNHPSCVGTLAHDDARSTSALENPGPSIDAVGNFGRATNDTADRQVASTPVAGSACQSSSLRQRVAGLPEGEKTETSSSKVPNQTTAAEFVLGDDLGNAAEIEPWQPL